MGPASKELTTSEAHKAFLDVDEVSVVGYFEKDDSPLAATFHIIAKKLREKVRFAHVSAEKLLDEVSHKYVKNLKMIKTCMAKNSFALHAGRK